MSLQSKLQEEANLLELRRTNEVQFMEVLFRTYYSPLCKAVNRIVRDKDTAEDIIQDVFIKVWNNRKELEINYSFKSYLYRAAINSALNFLEKQKRNVPLENAEGREPSINSTELMVNLKEMQLKLEEALEKLPPACKAIFILSRYDNLSNRDIAETLQLSIKTVENQMGKALKLLKEYLKEYTKHLLSLLF